MNNHYAPPQSDLADVKGNSGTGISNTMIEAMRGTKPWVLLIGIVLIVSSSFMILGSIGVFIASTIHLESETSPPGVLAGVGAMYAVLGVVYIFMAVYLLKYNSAIGRLLGSATTADMEDALLAQRKFWRLAGIITAIMLVVMVIGILVAISVPIFMQH